MPFVSPIVNALRCTQGIMRQALLGSGWQGTCSEEDIPYLFAEYRNRVVEPLPREVFISPELHCPVDLQPGLDEIIQRLRKGEDVRPFQSSSIVDVEYKDPFLSDWGIHHFHLSLQVQPNGFMERTGPVLLAIIERGCAFLIAVKQHGRMNPNLWVQTDILENVRKHWPKWMERFRLNGISPGNPISESDRKKLRKGRVVTFVELSDGHLYMPMGMGLSTAGTSAKAGMAMDKMLRAVERWEADILRDCRKYQQIFFPGIQKWPEQFSVLLGIEGNQLYATSEGSLVKIGIAQL